MRSHRLRGCLVIAALFAGSSASAQDNPDQKTDEKTEEKTAEKTAEKTETPAAPARVAQAEPTAPPSAGPSAGPSPVNPAPQPMMAMTEEQLRKMIDEQVVKMRGGNVRLDFNGYARAGVGLAIRGGKQVCFNLPGADTHWRLGNECDYVIEPQFTGRLVNLPDGSSWGVVAMPGLYRTWEDQNGADKTWFNDVPAVFRQIYFFGENIPQLAGGRVWGGRRYYDRLHLDINDQFLEIHDSDGAGVEDMKVGPGKFSVAFLMNPNSEADQVLPTGATVAISTANKAPFKLNLRYTDIPTVPNGNLQIWGGWQGYSTSVDQKDAGVIIVKPDDQFRLAAYHQLNKVLGGTNLVGVKGEFGTNFLQVRGVVEEHMMFNNDHTSFDVIGEFRTKRTRPAADTVTENWGSLGARVDTQISGPFRFLFEAGWDRVFPETGEAPQLIKATACLAINAGDVSGARPTVRLFYTQGFWNDAAKALFAAGAGGNRIAQVYGDKTTGSSVGLQAEAWW
jgi:maltoporin